MANTKYTTVSLGNTGKYKFCPIFCILLPPRGDIYWYGITLVRYIISFSMPHAEIRPHLFHYLNAMCHHAH